MISSVDAIAGVCYEANRAWCRELHGHCDQPEWENAPSWLRDLVINDVRYHLRNPNASAAVTHKAWMSGRLLAGWSWGPVEDLGTKQDPCLLDFTKLPPDQRLRVYLFLGVVHGLTALSGLPNPEVDIIDLGDDPSENDATT
jgi:hypothetical protein